MAQRQSKARRSPWPYLVVAVIALAAYAIYSGSALKMISVPGWFSAEFFNRSSTSARPTPSRDFFVGRWQVDQAVGPLSGASTVDYQRDGTFKGWQTVFIGGTAEKQLVTGKWEVEKVSDDAFRLSLSFANGQPRWQGTFRIFDQDHVQNTDQNYVATRLK